MSRGMRWCHPTLSHLHDHTSTINNQHRPHAASTARAKYLCLVATTSIGLHACAADVDLLPFGSGRTRPIPDGEYAYAQQMSREEITTFLTLRCDVVVEVERKPV
jgi:hypothetical protein